MRAKLRNRLTYANVVATLALFVALGGSSYAAVTLKRNAVKSRHITKNAVTSPKVKNASLLSQDFAPGQLPAGERGLQGERGPEGAPGSALAYAHLDAFGTPDMARSKNLVRATRRCQSSCGPAQFPNPATGEYCLDFAVSPKNAVATLSDSSTGGQISTTISQAPCQGHDGGSFVEGAWTGDVLVRTWEKGGNTLTDKAFYIAIN